MGEYDEFAPIVSIGSNCEFGMIQREVFKTEPLSLLRWGGSPDRGLLAQAFTERFAGLAEGMTGGGDPWWLPPEQQHYWLTDTRYGLVFHSEYTVARFTVEQARLASLPRLRRSAQFLLEDIEEAERLFLYSDKTLPGIEAVMPLFEAFRSIGPAWMLVVRQDPEQAGSARVVRDGLIAGHVRMLTEPDQANTYQWETWPAMLRQALALWRAHR